jgi:hypothetical protein
MLSHLRLCMNYVETKVHVPRTQGQEPFFFNGGPKHTFFSLMRTEAMLAQ